MKILTPTLKFTSALIVAAIVAAAFSIPSSQAESIVTNGGWYSTDVEDAATFVNTKTKKTAKKKTTKIKQPKQPKQPKEPKAPKATKQKKQKKQK